MVQWRDGPCQLLHDYDGDDDDDDDRDMSGADVRGGANILNSNYCSCLLYTSPSPRD